MCACLSTLVPLWVGGGFGIAVPRCYPAECVGLVPGVTRYVDHQSTFVLGGHGLTSPSVSLSETWAYDPQCYGFPQVIVRCLAVSCLGGLGRFVGECVNVGGLV